MDTVKKIAIVVIVASIVIGSAYGLIATSSSSKNNVVYVTAKILSLSNSTACPGVTGNFSDWVQLYVSANRTDLILSLMTIVTANPSISLQISLEENVSSYVSYNIVNSTYQIINVPIPSYWPVGGSAPNLSVSYYYTGNNPTAPTTYSIGPTKVVKGTLSC